MATIRDLLSLSDYAKRSAPQLPTEQSVRWLLRQHGQRLRAVGAIVKLNGRLWVVPGLMDEVVLQIAQEVAARANSRAMN